MAEETLLDADKNAVMRTARMVLAEPLQKAVADFAAMDETALSLDDHGQIQWQVGDDKIPVAALTKGGSFYTPKIKLLHTDLLDEQQNKALLQKLDAWMTGYTRKHLGALLDLEKTEVKGTAKGIAFQLYEQTGIMLRSQVQDMLAIMDKEERKTLGNLGIKLGAYYLYHKDTLKPAAIQAKAILYRALHRLDAEQSPLPQAGNVSMACPERGDQDFYRLMGLPVFGKTCVRVDMVERLNSEIFDKAAGGKYAFDPALASTVGVSVETVQSILHDLGFRHEDVTEMSGEGEEKIEKTTRFYHVKKRPPRLEEKPKPQKPPKSASKHPDKQPKPFHQKEERKSKAPSGYNAFAGLAAFKNKE